MSRCSCQARRISLAALGADPLDLGEALRAVLDDVQRLQAEGARPGAWPSPCRCRGSAPSPGMLDPATVAGATVRYEATRNWRPYLGSSIPAAGRRRFSPGCTPRRLPTAVTGSRLPGDGELDHAPGVLLVRMKTTRSSTPSRVAVSRRCRSRWGGSCRIASDHTPRRKSSRRRAAGNALGSGTVCAKMAAMPDKPLVLVIDDETGSRESMAHRHREGGARRAHLRRRAEGPRVPGGERRRAPRRLRPAHAGHGRPRLPERGARAASTTSASSWSPATARSSPRSRPCGSAPTTTSPSRSTSTSCASG